MAAARHDGASLTSAWKGIGTCRFTAPELLLPEESDYDYASDTTPLKPTCQSDIWSLAMLVLELLTENVPFAELNTTSAVILAVARGDMPKHPASSLVLERGLDDGVWLWLESCWSKEPSERPQLATLWGFFDEAAHMQKLGQGGSQLAVTVRTSSHILFD